jgi:hypothetical protein
MSYAVTTTPNIGGGSATNVGNGVKTAPISGLRSSTTYRWRVRVTDTSGHVTQKDYWFTTGPYVPNSAPTSNTPTLISELGGNTDAEDLIASNRTTADANGNKVTNIYNWLKNGVPIANLNFPFDTTLDSDKVYSGTAVTRDYSGRGNSGTVFGATRTVGIVGSALSFDGNDFVRVEEQSNSLGGSGTWSQISIEFWTKATASVSSPAKLIWKPDRYESDICSYSVEYTANLGTNSMQLIWTIYTSSRTYALNYTVNAATNWHHVVMTYRSGVGQRIYIDGVQRATKLGSTISGNINATVGSPLQIGFGGRRGNFIGVLDEIRIYPNEISSALVNQRYSETRNGSTKSSRMVDQETRVGDNWSCQVTPNDGLTDGITRTSNTVTIGGSTGNIFEDGFESGNFNAWSGTTVTTGSTATVVSNIHYGGSFSGQFNVLSGTSTRRAYVYKNSGGSTEVSAGAYVYIADGLPLASGQSMWLIQLEGPVGTLLASFGIRADASGSHWAVQSGNYPLALASSSVPLPVEGQWYQLTAYYTHASTGKTIILTVNGVEVASLSQNTAAASSIVRARYGISYYGASSTARIYVDNATLET